MASWDRCAIYLKTNANATEKWLPLVRDGLIEFTPTLKRLDDSGAFVDADAVAPTIVLECTPFDLEKFNAKKWRAALKELKRRHPMLGVVGASQAKPLLKKLPVGSVVAYDADSGFVSSIGGHIEKYLIAERDGWTPADAPAPKPTAPPKPAAPKPKPAVKRKADQLTLPTASALPVPAPVTPGDRWEGYCGGIPELVKFAKKHGNSGGMSTLQVQKWYKRNPHKLPTWLRGHPFSVDHLISDKLGGHPFVFNYFVMPKSTNAKFGMYLTREKEDYVGPSAFTYACQFARWCRNTTRAYVDYSDFDPIVDSYIGRA